MTDKRIYLSGLAFAAAILLTGACAKEADEDETAAKERRVTSWIQVHYPDAELTDDGIYLIEDNEGSGDLWDAENMGYAYVTLTARDLNGSITSTTDEATAKQIGTWSRTGYYGPTCWTIIQGGYPDAYLAILDGMRIGGTRKALFPSWTLASGTDHTLVDLGLVYQADDIYDYQVEKLEAFSEQYMESADSTYYNGTDGDSFGFYFHRLRANADETAMPTDTTVYINYTGRRLDGVVFDTTIADTAKFYGIYNAGKTYDPVPIYWAEEADDITMTSSKTAPIDGFKYLLWNMRPDEKAIAAFTSTLGYGASGSGSSIPAFAPLSFTVEMVEEP